MAYIVGVWPLRISSPLQPATTVMTSDVSSYLSKRRSRRGYTVIVLGASTQAAYADRETAAPGSQLRVFDHLPLCETFGACHWALDLAGSSAGSRCTN